METLSFLHLLPPSFANFAWGVIVVVPKVQRCSCHRLAVLCYLWFGGWIQQPLKGRLLTAIFKKAPNNKGKHFAVYNA